MARPSGTRGRRGPRCRRMSSARSPSHIVAAGQRQLNRFVHRLRPLVPPAGWEVLQTLQSHSRGGPLVLTPPHKRALVVAPHPDDEVLGCGGTTALLCANAREVRTLIATAGDRLPVQGLAPLDIGALRRDDALRASVALGAPPPVFLGFDDGTLRAVVDDLSALISRHVAEFRPDAIYAPWLLDAHADHRALAMAVALASVPATTEVWGYEVWAASPANRLVDVTSMWDTKCRALGEHRVPAGVFDTAGHLALNRWRSILGTGSGYMEAYCVLRFSAYSSLAAALRAAPPHQLA